ncbi:MAG: acyltransferase [Pseudomonadota bacterium]
MLRQIIERTITRAKGVDVRIDPAVETSHLVGLARRQAFALMRGLFRWRAPIYLEPGVQFRGRGRIRIGRSSKIGARTLIEGLSKEGVEIGAGVTLGRYGRIRATATLTQIGKGVRIGDYVGIGDFFYLGAFGGIDIGPETIVGERLTIHSDNHDFDDVSTAIRRQATTAMPVSIGARCWFGSNVTILGGVEIGDDCVIGAGSVVTRSFPAGSIIVGNPGRMVRNRFDRAPSATIAPSGQE